MKARSRRPGRYPIWVGVAGLSVIGFLALRWTPGCGPEPGDVVRMNARPDPDSPAELRHPDWPDDEEVYVIDPTAPGGKRAARWGDIRPRRGEDVTE